MDFTSSGAESRRVIAALNRDRTRLNRESVQVLKDAARKHKPAHAAGYDSIVSGLRARYEGKQHVFTRRRLAQRFPTGAKNMPDVGHNYVRHFSEVDASVYDEPATRHLEKDGEKVEDEGKAAEFAALIKRAKLGAVMLDTERKLQAVDTMFLRPDWGPVRVDAKGNVTDGPTLQAWWPSDVLVIPYDAAPAQMETSLAVILKYAPDQDGKQRDEIWTRATERDERGKVTSWGPWLVEVVDEDGKGYWPYESSEYPGALLPIVRWTRGIPCGSPFLPVDEDLPLTVDELNCDWSDYRHTISSQAHTARVYIGDTMSESQIAVGPDVITKIGTGEDFRAVPMSPLLDEMAGGIERTVRTLEVVRRNAPGAYSPDAQAPESGVARQIKNEPQTKKRREAIEFARDVDAAVCAVLIEQSDLWGGTSIGEDGLVSVLTPGQTPEYEDPEARQRRHIEARDAGGISDARCFTAAGFYASVDEAVGAGLSDELKTRPSAVPADGETSSFSSRLRDGLGGRSEEPEEEQEKPAADEPPAQATVTDGITINELTLGIERLGRLGDIETLNILRRALAQKLGVTYEGDLTAQDLAGEAKTVLAAETLAKTTDVPDRPAAEE